MKGRMTCILCGGDHEPSVAACAENESGMNETIARIGAKRFNRLSGRVQSVHNLPNLKALYDDIARARLAQDRTR